VLAPTHAPDLSHLTIFANGQKQICQALKGSAPRTATITEAEGDCVCMCAHVHAHVCMHVPAVLFQQLGCTLFWNSPTKSTDDCVIFSSLGPQNTAGILKFKTLAKHSHLVSL
jgi:hypothetical protein